MCARNASSESPDTSLLRSTSSKRYPLCECLRVLLAVVPTPECRVRHDSNHLRRKVVIQHKQICNTSRAAEAATRQKPTDCGSVSAVPICRWFIVPATILSQLRHSRDPFAQDTPVSEPVGASPALPRTRWVRGNGWLPCASSADFQPAIPFAVLAEQPPGDRFAACATTPFPGSVEPRRCFYCDVSPRDESVATPAGGGGAILTRSVQEPPAPLAHLFLP